MFTGIILNTAKIAELTVMPHGNTLIRFDLEKPETGVMHGESIAFDGVCLSMVDFGTAFLCAEMTPETVQKTVFTKYPQRTVNVERSLCVGDKIGGHIIQGHVDGIITLAERTETDGKYELVFTFDRDTAPYFVEKGSASINGVSLTVFDVTQQSFRVAVIPDTLEKTNLSELSTGDECHLETDIIGRYLYRFYTLTKHP